MAIPTSDVLKTGNENIGIIDNLLGKNADSFHDYFYSSFLATANSFPLNCLWMVYIESVPAGIIDKYLKFRDNGWGANGSLSTVYDKAKTEADPLSRKNGLVIVQGIKQIGDAINITRMGIQNTGFIKGMVSEGREGFPALGVQFAETNLSFIDYVLRPWLVAVAHESLKNRSLMTNIYVWHLGKMGAGEDMAKRKVVKYINCAPINIAEEEYNYTGGDILKTREVQFCYDWMEYEAADAALYKLITTESDMNSFLSNITNGLKDELQRQFGANSLGGYINDMVDRAVSYGEQLVSGTARTLVTNTAGSIQDAVNGAVTGLESAGRSAASGLTNGVNDLVNDLLGNESSSGQRSTNSSGNATQQSVDQIDTNRRLGVDDTGYGGYTEKPNPKDDTPVYIKTIEEIQLGKPAEVEVNKEINPNDAPIHEGTTLPEPAPSNTRTPTSYNDDTVMMDTPLTYTIKKTKMDDVRHGEINWDKGVSINQNDYVTGLQLNTNEKNINQADARTGVQLSNEGKLINENDVRTGNQTSQSGISINQNDVRVKGVAYQNVEKQIKKDDARTKGDQVSYIVRQTKQDDFINRGT